MDMNSKYKMLSGYEIPLLGYGVSFVVHDFPVISYQRSFAAESLDVDIADERIGRFIKRKALSSRHATTVDMRDCRPASEAEDVVLHAFKTGYRHVGTLRVVV